MVDLKFGHIADCHLGAWRVPVLQELSLKAFEKCIGECIKEKVNFVLIAGDLFDTATPSVDVLKFAAAKLMELKNAGIQCYVIPGSHDFSLSGKTFLDILEVVGLFKNIGGYTENENGVDLEVYKTNQLLLAGLPGKKAGLEQKLVKKIKKMDLDKNLFKILTLHTTITESKPKKMEFAESLDANDLPQGFDYYALGHLHKKAQGKTNGKTYVYPGPVFPTSFDEFEEEKTGSFCIVNVENNKVDVKIHELNVKDVQNIEINADKKTTGEIMEEALISIKDIKNKIVTLKIEGELLRGKPSDVNLQGIFDVAKKNDCIILKNTTKLTSPEFKTEIESSGKDIKEIEEEIIKKYSENAESKEFLDKISTIIYALDIEKQDGETNVVFENKIMEDVSKIFNIKQ